ncbi:MAG: hemagglutinin [Chloroflexi bacterium]|nr:hemagglutinin [Chloroflexota bacterium]
MELRTFGAILTFAAEWEGEAAGWYGLHTEGAQAERLAELAAAARRREARLRRTRQEGVSEMILVPISGLDTDRYQVPLSPPQEGEPPLEGARRLEEARRRFYGDAAAAMPIGEVAALFARLARENARHLEALGEP